ncbi:SEL1-like repeat protein [Limnobaculum xujianqingii]|uniref:SEL1-like repeat protein n=1 Tax=Limnobaculum xujianqingii TaxID=2738837 RepID=UPI00112BB2F3|nr:tetratricopeptide repeat protein [Limnobaculum xujianqingii]
MNFITRFLSRRSSPTDAEEQFQLAKRYVAQSEFSQAVYWYEQAAVQGSTNAQNNLGLLYEHGSGVLADIKQALSLYRQAAELGNAKAQHNLGRLYHLGEGVEQDYQQATFWYLKAIEKEDHPYSLYALGTIYYDETFLGKDWNKAILYWQRAAQNNFSEAQFRLGSEYHFGGAVEMDSKQAVYWYQQAAGQQHPISLFNLAYMYDDGTGCLQDREKGFSCLQRSAELGYFQAQLNLFYMYQHGEGVERNSEKAFYWCQKAAAQNNTEALCCLSIFYLNSGDNTQCKKAVNILHKLAAQNVPDAQFLLGIACQEGRGIDQEPQLAIDWYTKAAEQGHRGAQRNLIAAQNMDIRFDRYAPDISMSPENLLLWSGTPAKRSK